MRKILGKIGSEDRHTFQADFGKYGYKRYHDSMRGELYSPTMVVRNLIMVDDPEHPQIIADHLWLNLTKGFADLGLLQEGDRLQFNGRVSEYSKGFINKDKKDYELSYPTKIQLLNERETKAIPEEHAAIIGMIMNLNYKFYDKMGRPLVPYFMDAFVKWQDQQEKPLPIECHKGNDFESDIKYDVLDYETEKAELEKKQNLVKEKQAQLQKAGVELLKKHDDLVEELVKIGKQAKEDKANSNSEYCYISNSKLAKALEKYGLDKDVQPKIKQALASDWFHEQFSGSNKQELSPLEALAQKFNQK
ncbi:MULTISPECIES: hypothetical protein [Lactobacillus]|uniref:Uncharacterized protein n=1 Tax=Lactobacillus xujianguonis TaxID=2495899 RepID=A0A437SVQ4_9LACO|nr:MULTISPECIES: hypothetical protein [Lactobacillus]RVU71005.1 hypothetical protein EJK17_04685 [Lactobacillus xujianguonis]RVU73925.1 hypothetical protein EJK20_05625 [Lactobacillus xujianguonis]